MKTNGKDSIYQFMEAGEVTGLDTISISRLNPGLTKREHFAIQILAGIKASTPGCANESCVYFAVKEADALITELNKETK